MNKEVFRLFDKDEKGHPYAYLVIVRDCGDDGDWGEYVDAVGIFTNRKDAEFCARRNNGEIITLPVDYKKSRDLKCLGGYME